MKISKFLTVFSLVLLGLSTSACSVVSGIFKTGMGVGIFIVVAIIILIIVLILRVGKTHD